MSAFTNHDNPQSLAFGIQGEDRSQEASHFQPKYRPEIDGLRAIAVLSVVFYHAGVRGFSGGFVGVDVFFVISGYLITSILRNDLARQRYSLAEFYRRRVQRIFPALFAMILVVSMVSAVAMLPVEIRHYSTSLLATVLFLSNFEFYRLTDYFELGSSARPLLHTWSLAVEEQWYLFWPLLLSASIFKARSRAVGLTVSIIAISFLLSVIFINIDSAATFYFLPTRAWELGLGAFLSISKIEIRNRLLNECAGIVGLALILLSVKMYTHETTFPGLAALPPCLGAFLLIMAGERGGVVTRALSLRPLTFVGLISYSLYLWHWPIIVFSEAWLFLPKTPALSVGVIALSFFAAIVSWRFVERPFRLGAGRFSTKLVLSGGGIAILCGAGLAVTMPVAANLLRSFPPHQEDMARYMYFDGDAAFRRGTCFMVGPRSAYDRTGCLTPTGAAPPVVLVGDSHAAHLWPGLSLYPSEIDVLQATFTGCVAKRYAAQSGVACRQKMNETLSGLSALNPSAVLFSSRWHREDVADLKVLFSDPLIRRYNPILVGPTPEYIAALPRLIVFSERNSDPGLVDRSRSDGVFELDAEMRAMAREVGVPYFSMTDLLCHDGRCDSLAKPGIPLQFDYGHLTPEGSELIAQSLVPFVLKAIAPAVGPTP